MRVYVEGVVKYNSDDKYIHGSDMEYKDYISSFTDTKNTFHRIITKMKGVLDYDFLDESSDENLLSGCCDKSCVRVGKEYFNDLIREIKRNPNSSYQTAYTREEIENDQIPQYLSVVIKEPSNINSLEAEVFSSRILNYFGLPVVYNRRIDQPIPNFFSRRYLMSVDFIRPYERFYSLGHIVPTAIDNGEVGRVLENGLKETMSCVMASIKKILNDKAVPFDKIQIDEIRKELFRMILARYIFLGDIDFRNGNIGLLIDDKHKTFRLAPNFDMGLSLSSISNPLRFDHLEEYYDYDTEEYNKFIDTMMKFIDGDEEKESDCLKLARKTIRDKEIADSFTYKLYVWAGDIWQTTQEIKQKKAKKETAEDESNLGLENQ